VRIRSHTLASASLLTVLTACSSGTGGPVTGFGTDTSTTTGSGTTSGQTSTATGGGTMASTGTGTGSASTGASTGSGTGSGASSGTGTGASTGTGTGTASGWNNPTPASGGANFPFPQNRKGSHCNVPSASPTTLNAKVKASYTKWLTLVSTGGAPANGARVMDPQGPPANRTVSEGIGYGMLITVYMNDKTTFDELWTYAKAHFDSHGLMNWEIDSSGSTIGNGSATDADEDMAWALLMADKQWGGYASAAQSLISAMSSTGELNGSKVPQIGDNSTNGNNTYPDYVSPAYYTAFGFTGAISAGYNELTGAMNATTHLVPDQLGGNSNFGYDACRAPWRVGMDYCFTGSSQALSFLTPMANYFVMQGANGMVLPMNLSGGPASGSTNGGALVGPAGVAAMALTASTTNQAFLDAMFNAAYQNITTVTPMIYFASSLGLIGMLVESGNFFDYANPPQ
jgi:endo-1,4-beta-D-glucanase Y